MNPKDMITTTEIIDSLALPTAAIVNQRVPKSMLIEKGALTAADKRYINSGIEELFWVAAIKPTTVGIPAYRDEVREYLEISILRLQLRDGAKAGRVSELIHRAIPYPVLLVSTQSDTIELSLAHKRNAQNEAGKVVLENTITICRVVSHTETPLFLDSLSLAKQPRAHLMALYQGWIDRVEAFQAALHTGRFVLLSTADAAAARRDALAKIDGLKREIAGLRTQAAKESQMPRRVTLNNEIKRLEAALAAAMANL